MTYHTTAPVLDGMVKRGATPKAAALYRLAGSSWNDWSLPTGHTFDTVAATRPTPTARARVLLATLFASACLALPAWSVLA